MYVYTRKHVSATRQPITNRFVRVFPLVQELLKMNRVPLEARSSQRKLYNIREKKVVDYKVQPELER